MSKVLTPEVIANVIAEYRRTRSPFKVANACGVDVKIVWQIVDENKDKLSSYAERHGGKGRPEMEQFLVASRHANDREWNNKDEGIVRARAAYEAGTHIMATGRDGQWLLLYLIPRKGPKQPRPGYFQPEIS
jgi:hypothetical protein